MGYVPASSKEPVSSSAAQPTDYTPRLVLVEGLVRTMGGSSVDPHTRLVLVNPHNHQKPFFAQFCILDAFHVRVSAGFSQASNSRIRSMGGKTETNDDVY